MRMLIGDRLKLAISLALAVLVTLGAEIVVWAGPPSAPCTFYGSVQVNDQDVPAGAEVSAFVYAADGVTEIPCGSKPVLFDGGHSKYALVVRGEGDGVPGAKEGDTVHFRVSFRGLSVLMEQTGVWRSATFVPLDLTGRGTLVLGRRAMLPLIHRR